VRLPVYQELADITINANRNSIRAVIEDIQNKLNAL
jgi:shikimate kinase